MVVCAVFGCKSNNNTKLKNVNIEGISFYRFPKDDATCKEWVNKCSRSDKFNTNNARVCSRHFNADDFERNLKYELLNIENPRKKLKEGAVPTRNMSKGTNNSNKRKERLALRENKLMVTQLLKSFKDRKTPTNETNFLHDIPKKSFKNRNTPIIKADSSQFYDLPIEVAIPEDVLLRNENEKLKQEVEKNKAEIEKLKTENLRLVGQIQEMNKSLQTLSKSNEKDAGSPKKIIAGTIMLHAPESGVFRQVILKVVPTNPVVSVKSIKTEPE